MLDEIEDAQEEERRMYVLQFILPAYQILTRDQRNDKAFLSFMLKISMTLISESGRFRTRAVLPILVMNNSFQVLKDCKRCSGL